MTGRLVVGISGATGICYGVRVLELARKAGVETHLVDDIRRRVLTNWNDYGFSARAGGI